MAIGASINSAVVGTTGTTDATETEVVQKRREKAKHLLKQVKFACKCTLDMVVFTPDNKDIISIGGILTKGWNAHMLSAFGCALKINILTKARTRKDCISYIINYKDNGAICEQLKSGGKVDGKKKSAATKPLCITNDGTLLRVINRGDKELKELEVKINK